MKNKVDYIQAINFINLFFTQQTKKTLKNKTESRKMGLWFFMVYFDDWISFILSQNANHAVNLDRL